MIDAALTALVTILVVAGYCLAIFLIALAWRIAVEHFPRRRAQRVRRALVDVGARRATGETPVRDRRALR
jgi:hypothetical protein